MGLIHPTDLDSWLTWHDRRQPFLRRARSAVKASSPPPVLTASEGEFGILISLQSTNRSNLAALVDPIAAMPSAAIGIIADRAHTELIDGDVTARPVESAVDIEHRHGPVQAAVVISGVGRAHQTAIDAARRAGGRVFVIQHGLLTPFAPPLPRDCTLLAWSEADAEFWRSGRSDVDVEVVGSQLLWFAAQRENTAIDPASRPSFLGQLHAAELDRRELARVSYEFCHANDARYRPHPAEIDKVSRLQHAIWRRRGVEFDTSGVALDDLAAPVAAIFSTGIVEAAAAGRPAWAYHPDPPLWVAELWDRYGLNRWGQDPTPTPATPAVEPAVRIAEILAATVPTQEA